MADLVEKYFHQDLTEEEDRVLTQELLNSDEASEKFLRLAEEAYVRYGLPAADWEGPLPRILPKPRAGWNRWFTLSALVLGLASGFYYLHHWKPWAPPVQASPQSQSTAGNSGFRKLLQETGSTTTRPPTSGEVYSSSWESPQGTDSPETNPAPSVPSAGLPGNATDRSTTPSESLSTQPGPSGFPAYSKISVDVSLSGPETLMVRVLDHHGTAVALLYSGPLAAGQWSFQWNGKTSEGSPASPGYYQIEIKSGSNIQRKNVQIR